MPPDPSPPPQQACYVHFNCILEPKSKIHHRVGTGVYVGCSWAAFQKRTQESEMSFCVQYRKMELYKLEGMGRIPRDHALFGNVY